MSELTAQKECGEEEEVECKTLGSGCDDDDVEEGTEGEAIYAISTLEARRITRAVKLQSFLLPAFAKLSGVRDTNDIMQTTALNYEPCSSSLLWR